MYDELVKMLRVCGDSNNSCGNCPARENDGSCPHGEWEFAAEKYMLQAADAIEELSKPRWIPVTERLPEDLKLVLVVEDGIVFVAHCEHYYGEEETFVEWHDTMHYPVSPTHWMPLPEPPKEE